MQPADSCRSLTLKAKLLVKGAHCTRAHKALVDSPGPGPCLWTGTVQRSRTLGCAVDGRIEVPAAGLLIPPGRIARRCHTPAAPRRSCRIADLASADSSVWMLRANPDALRLVTLEDGGPCFAACAFHVGRYPRFNSGSEEQKCLFADGMRRPASTEYR